MSPLKRNETFLYLTFILTFIHQKELYELFMWALYVLYYDLLIK